MKKGPEGPQWSEVRSEPPRGAARLHSELVAQREQSAIDKLSADGVVVAAAAVGNAAPTAVRCPTSCTNAVRVVALNHDGLQEHLQRLQRAVVEPRRAHRRR